MPLELSQQGLKELAAKFMLAAQRSQPQRAPAADRIMRLARKLHSLRMEGLRLYSALPHLAEFHACTCQWRLLFGGNRASKTESAMAEACRVWTGTDPFDKYPPTNGNSTVIAQDEDGLAMLWRKATESSFKMIPDEHTGIYRAVRPDPNNPLVLDPYDEAYKEKWKDAAPLLPMRMVAHIAWTADGIPANIRFTSGWKALWKPSGGPATQGDHYQFALLDEQLKRDDHFKETTRGIVPLNTEIPKYWPKAVWSATSQRANHQLSSLYRAAQDGSPHIRMFHTTIELNPFVPPEGKKFYFDSLTPEERRTRYYGEAADSVHAIYGIYDPMGIHGCEPFALPLSWCRYAVTDPGSAHLATLLFAVDPDQCHAWVYDGFDLIQADHNVWAAEMARKQGDRKFEAILFDSHMGKERSVGLEMNQNVATQYFEALRSYGLAPRSIGSLQGFFPAQGDVAARQESLLGWMRPRDLSSPHAGTPYLQVMKGVCPELDEQIRRACMNPDNINKRLKLKKVPDDLVTCLEYAAAFNPGYWPPEPCKDNEPPEVANAYDLFQEKQSRMRRRMTDLAYT